MVFKFKKVTIWRSGNIVTEFNFDEKGYDLSVQKGYDFVVPNGSDLYVQKE